MDLVKRKEWSKCEAEGKQEGHDHILWLCADRLKEEQTRDVSAKLPQFFQVYDGVKEGWTRRFLESLAEVIFSVMSVCTHTHTMHLLMSVIMSIFYLLHYK